MLLARDFLESTMLNCFCANDVKHFFLADHRAPNSTMLGKAAIVHAPSTRFWLFLQEAKCKVITRRRQGIHIHLLFTTHEPLQRAVTPLFGSAAAFWIEIGNPCAGKPFLVNCPRASTSPVCPTGTFGRVTMRITKLRLPIASVL